MLQHAVEILNQRKVVGSIPQKVVVGMKGVTNSMKCPGPSRCNCNCSK